MSFEALQERLTVLQENATQVKELIDRLAGLKFQPGSVPLSADEENSVSGELSAEIGQILRSGLEDQELLLEEVSYLRPEGAGKERLKESVARVGNEFASYRLAFRGARVAAKKSLVEAQKLERQLILKSYSEPIAEPDDASPDVEQGNGAEEPAPRFTRHAQHQHQQQMQSSLSEEDKQTVGASSNVTNALRRTHDLIASELARSEFAHETLTESSAALKQLNESYGSLDSMLVKSRDLLGTLLRSQKSDTWYLQTAFYMLVVTAGWLVFRRLLYGPMWWLVLFPLRVLFGVGSKATLAVLPLGKAVSAASTDAGAVDAQDEVTVEGLPPKDLPTAKVGEDEDEDDEGEGGVLEEVMKVVEGAVGDDEGMIAGHGKNGAGGGVHDAMEAIVGDDEGHIRDEGEEGAKGGFEKLVDALVGDGDADVQERDEL